MPQAMPRPRPRRYLEDHSRDCRRHHGSNRPERRSPLLRIGLEQRHRELDASTDAVGVTSYNDPPQRHSALARSAFRHELQSMPRPSRRHRLHLHRHRSRMPRATRAPPRAASSRHDSRLCHLHHDHDPQSGRGQLSSTRRAAVPTTGPDHEPSIKRRLRFGRERLPALRHHDRARRAPSPAPPSISTPRPRRAPATRSSLESNTTWGETTITYANAPALGSTITSVGSTTANAYSSATVTGAVTTRGLISFGITDPSTTTRSRSTPRKTRPPPIGRSSS
jgi:hypothetical protein